MKFKFFIGGYFSGHFEIVFKKEQLIGFISNHPIRQLKPTHIFPIHEDPDWEVLLKYFKTLKWKAIYDAGICDGTQWTLEVIHDNFNIKSYGSNVYPHGFKKLIRLLNSITKKQDVTINL